MNDLSLFIFQDKMKAKQKYRQQLISTKEKLEQEHYRRNQIERRKQQESQAKVNYSLFKNIINLFLRIASQDHYLYYIYIPCEA